MKDEIDNSQDLKSIAKSLEVIAKTYASTHKSKPFWKNKYFWSICLLSAGLFGYGLNWWAEIKNLEATRLERQIEYKLSVQKAINAAVIHNRIVIVNQMLECPLDKKNKIVFKAERNKAIEQLIATGSGIRFIFDDEITAVLHRECPNKCVNVNN